MGEIKKITLSDKQIDCCVKEIQTEYSCLCDGCLCGTYEIQLESVGIVTLTRHCKNSSGCTNGQQWSIDPEVYITNHSVADSNWCEVSILGVLDYEQSKILIAAATKQSIEDIGFDGNGFCDKSIYDGSPSKSLAQYIKGDMLELSHEEKDIFDVYSRILLKMKELHMV